jgi:hypothetical protein
MTQQTKNRLLVIGFVIAFFIVYKLGIARTLDFKERLIKAETEANQFNGLNQLQANLMEKEKQLDSILAVNNVTADASVQNTLLKILSTNISKGNFKISEFNEPHVYKRDGAIVTSYQFALQGDYLSIEKVLALLEQKFSLGKIKNIKFDKKRNYRSRKDYLECVVILEYVSY